MLIALLCLLHGHAPNAPGHGDNLLTRFSPPPGFHRIAPAHRSFGAYLRAVHLLPEGAPVLLFNGEPKYRQDVHAAVLDIPVGN